MMNARIAIALALCAVLTPGAADTGTNPLARGTYAFDGCKNHYILSAPDPCGTQEEASWTVTGAMKHARAGHTATLLLDGTVLVVGGGVTSAELYDWRTRAWSETAPTLHALSPNSATLLADGRVLFLSTDGDLNPSEIYDPATRAWAPVAQMLVPREAATATLLDNGKVLVVGGVDNDDVTIAAAELYDPATDTWALTGNATPRWGHTATKLRDGRVLIAGGAEDDWIADSTASSEIYDPASGRFTATGDMQVARATHVDTLLADGSVLVSGGFWRFCPWDGSYCRFETLASTERFDPTTGSWTPAGQQTTPREGDRATLLADGSVLLTGGGMSIGAVPHLLWQTVAYSERSDDRGSHWAHPLATHVARSDHTATLLPDGTVLVAGGVQDDQTMLDSAEIYARRTSP